jgi:hypothetical protein
MARVTADIRGIVRRAATEAHRAPEPRGAS